jgi:cytosine/adenosine deaminase-related metal-dependent hydrolase
MRNLIIALALMVGGSTLATAQEYDVVVEGGRVMDPETGLDAVRNVGIREGRIASISTAPLSGRRVIHAAGLVVAPGFIDLHQHAQDTASQRVKAFDGVTTALEMEIGAPDVTQFLKAKEGRSLIHYGTTASQVAARALVFGAPLPEGTILPKSGAATDQLATPEQIQRIQQRLRDEIDAGALGIGMGIEYTPGATRLEVIDMFRVAAERRLPVYTHMRSAGHGSNRDRPFNPPRKSSERPPSPVQRSTLFISTAHACATRWNASAMIEGARARGLDVTTEAYPYIAGMTAINSAVFNPGWREKLGIDYSNLVVPDTGEHLTKERFDELHNSSKPQWVLIFSNTQEIVDAVYSESAGHDRQRRHRKPSPQRRNFLPSPRPIRPREKNALSDGSAPQDDSDARSDARAVHARRVTGRDALQEGADADVVIFDPQTIADRSTFEKPMEPSVGVQYLLVGGTVVIDDGKLVPDVFPGRALLGPGKAHATGR